MAISKIFAIANCKQKNKDTHQWEEILTILCKNALQNILHSLALLITPECTMHLNTTFKIYSVQLLYEVSFNFMKVVLQTLEKRKLLYYTWKIAQITLTS